MIAKSFLDYNLVPVVLNMSEMVDVDLEYFEIFHHCSYIKLKAVKNNIDIINGIFLFI